MLVYGDEWLLHQVARPMAQTTVSDHRFFDRHWFGGAHPTGEVAFILGMGAYKNMNVLDGFISIRHQHRQHNLRLSRVLHSAPADMCVGPLRLEIVEPFRHIRLAVDENEHGIGCRLDWKSDHQPHVEAHHFDVFAESITQDSTRYDQAGTVSGWIMIEGRRYEVSDWWSVRDHSWGVRPGVGGFEPIRGDHSFKDAPQPKDRLRLWLWSCFSTEEFSCQFQQQEDADGKVLYRDGEVLYCRGFERAPLKLEDLAHDISFIQGTNAYDRLRYVLTLSDGSKMEIEAVPLGRAWAYSGTGYDGGYDDRRGLGAQRGNLVPEYDVCDLSHVEEVRDAKGRAIPPGHREQPVRLTVDGQPGFGHFPVMVFKSLVGMGST